MSSESSQILLAPSVNWYNFDHTKVDQKFSGGLTFVNSFAIKDQTSPAAIYFVDKPDRELGHKDYLLLNRQIVGFVEETPQYQWYVTGLDWVEMEEYRYRPGIQCQKCGDQLLSVHRHHKVYCSCKSVSIDGGGAYSRISGRRENILDLRFDMLRGMTPQTMRKV